MSEITLKCPVCKHIFSINKNNLHQDHYNQLFISCPRKVGKNRFGGIQHCDHRVEYPQNSV